jgi:hypothetical protein
MNLYLSIMEDNIAAAEQPWPGPLEETENVSDKYLGRIGRFHILTQQSIPATQATVEAAARGTANCRIMALAIALERYRRAKAHAPVRLDDLAPDYISAVPLDPFTGLRSLPASARAPSSLAWAGIKPDQTDAETGARLAPLPLATEAQTGPGRGKMGATRPGVGAAAVEP